jgi:hypothetical protein
MIGFRDFALQILNSSRNSSMSGGAARMSGKPTGSGWWVTFFLTVLVVFFIKAFLIYFTYNLVVPRVLESMNVTGWERFREISYWDALLLMILVNNLTN